MILEIQLKDGYPSLRPNETNPSEPPPHPDSPEVKDVSHNRCPNRGGVVVHGRIPGVAESSWRMRRPTLREDIKRLFSKHLSESITVLSHPWSRSSSIYGRSVMASHPEDGSQGIGTDSGHELTIFVPQSQKVLTVNHAPRLRLLTH